MKNRILVSLALVLTMCFVVTVYAYNGTSATTDKTKANCCADKDSCPMKSKDKNSADKASCCDKEDCCCKGDSCPMKSNGEKTEGKSDCCGGSCPMKKDADKQTSDATSAEHCKHKKS